MRAKMDPSTSSQVIEDEPSHEIYANLIGIKMPLKKVVHSNHASTPPRKYSESIFKIGDASVIPVNGELEEESNQYTSIYRKRLAEPLEVSQLSLDKSNKGFQILARMGWREKDGGLGKDRQGKLSPVKTILKRNKHGLGAARSVKARVTHTQDQLDTKQNSKNGGRQNSNSVQKNRKNHQEQQRDKKARMLLSSDIPEEYLGLF